MSAFNPYSHWLGLAGKEKPDSYYELLGLKFGEKNVAKIAEHADSLVSKVQKMGPEGHFPEWNQILTEIQVAKNCLCNPKYKSDYDAKHQPSAPAFDPSALPSGMASPFDAGNTVPPIPAQSAPQQPQAMPQQPGMQPGMMGMQPGMMPMQPGMQPGMMGMQPGMMPMQNLYGGMIYQQPGMVQQVGMGQPAQVAQAVVPPQVAPASPMPQAVVPPSSMPVMGVTPSAQPVSPATPAGGVDSLFGAGSPSSAPAASARSSAKSGSKNASKGYGKSSKASGPSPMVRNAMAIGGLLIIAFFAYQLVLKRDRNPEDALIQVRVNEDGGTSVQFNNPLAPKAAPEEAQPMAAASPEEVPAASADFQVPDFDGMMNYLHEFKFSEANQLLAVARGMHLAPANEARLKRMELVVTKSQDFFKNVSKVLQSMTPPQELCEGECSLVEANEKRTIIRINGKNIEFTMAKPKSHGHDLFDIIYRHRFASAIESGNMLPAMEYATFQFVAPDGNREKAQKLFNQIVEKGNDTDRENVHLILEEFGVNGLGALADSGEAARADAKEEPAAEEPKESEKTDQTANAEEKTKKDATSDAEYGEAKDENADSGSEKVAKSGKKSKKSAEKTDSEAESAAAAEKEKSARELERHQNEWKQIATSVRQDVGARRIASAKRNLTQLEKIAETDEEKHEIDRLTALTDYMESFTAWVGNHMGDFTPASTVNVNGQDLGIVESASGRLVIREQGVNKTYTTENLNPKLVDWLVGKSLKEADDYVLYGAYLAMDPEGDRAKAKTFWSTAISKGFSKDSIDLIMEELEVPLVDSGRRPSQQTVRNPRGKNQSAAAEPQTIPTGEDREKALAKLQKDFAKDYATDDRGAQSRLAKKFLKMAQAADRSPDEAYVMAEEAVRMAAEHSFFETAYQALMVQESRFGRDTYQDRLALIQKADPTARGQSSANELASCAVNMGVDAIQRGKKIEANQMLNIARKNAKGPEVQRVRELERMISTMK